MVRFRNLFALVAALGVLMSLGGASASAQAAEVDVAGTPVTYAEPWRPSILPPVIAADNAVLKDGAWAVVISVPAEGTTFADQVLTGLATFAPHLASALPTVSSSGDVYEAGTFQNSGETYACVALAPTATVPFVQIVTAPEADLGAAVTSAQGTLTIGDTAVFAGVTIDDQAITVQTAVPPAASPAASPVASPEATPAT